MTQGVLRLEWPYTELHEALYPEDWRFDGADHLAVFRYHLAPNESPHAMYDAAVR